MTNVISHVVDNSFKERLDVVVLRLLGDEYSRSFAQNAIKDCLVKVNDVVITKQSIKLSLGDVVEVKVIEKSNDLEYLTPLTLDLDIVFENENLVVVNKPAGLTTHPGAGNKDKTLVNALLYRYGNLTDVPRIGIVHRLDKDTSGLIIVAKHTKAQIALSQLIKDRKVDRRYLTLCYGVPVPSSGTIDTHIIRDRNDITRMKVHLYSVGNSKHAVTHYAVKEIFLNGAVSLVECKLDTGRTHQIRAHMLHIKHPILGDPIYKNRYNSKLPDNFENIIAKRQQLLHSYRLNFIDPISNEEIDLCFDPLWLSDLSF